MDWSSHVVQHHCVPSCLLGSRLCVEIVRCLARLACCQNALTLISVAIDIHIDQCHIISRKNFKSTISRTIDRGKNSKSLRFVHENMN
jgi:hypothetical protein